MIYTVTFNPAIDYVVRLDAPLEVGAVNRAQGRQVKEAPLEHQNSRGNAETDEIAERIQFGSEF